MSKNNQLAIVQKDVALDETAQHAIDAVKRLKDMMIVLKAQELKEGIDYGVIPGTGKKPTLYKPGMEKVMRMLSVIPQFRFETKIEDFDKGLFHYVIECTLVDVEFGSVIPGARGVGSCSSYESKYRYRWVFANQLSGGIDPSTLRSRKTRRGDMQYQIPNPDIFDQANPVLKVAKKRALGDAVNGAAAISEFFNLDLEDYTIVVDGEVEGNTVVEGEYTTVTEPTGQNGMQGGETTEHDLMPAVLNALKAAGHVVTEVSVKPRLGLAADETLTAAKMKALGFEHTNHVGNRVAWMIVHNEALQSARTYLKMNPAVEAINTDDEFLTVFHAARSDAKGKTGEYGTSAEQIAAFLLDYLAAQNPPEAQPVKEVLPDINLDWDESEQFYLKELSVNAKKDTVLAGFKNAMNKELQVIPYELDGFKERNLIPAHIWAEFEASDFTRTEYDLTDPDYLIRYTVLAYEPDSNKIKDIVRVDATPAELEV